MESDPNLDDDVAAMVEENAAKRGVPFRRALNDLVRTGLDYVPQQQTGEIRQTRAFHMGSSLMRDSFSETMELLKVRSGDEIPR